MADSLHTVLPVSEAAGRDGVDTCVKKSSLLR